MLAFLLLFLYATGFALTWTSIDTNQENGPLLRNVYSVLWPLAAWVLVWQDVSGD